MNILLILGHQNPQQNSFCHAIARTARETLEQAGCHVVVHDLYAEDFDPVLTHAEIPPDATLPDLIDTACRELVEADGYLVVHPNWWGQPPAMLKGWIDRVFRQGVAYEFGPNGVNGLLKEKRALVLTTSNTPRDIEHQAFGDPLENLWKNCIFGFCGTTHFRRRNFESIVLGNDEQRRAWLEEVHQIVREHFTHPARG